MVRYEFLKEGIYHVIDLKFSLNRKLGQGEIVLQTYHFSEVQVITGDFKQDKANCLDCRYSYNSGNGKCYTHIGRIGLGLRSMLKRLHKNPPKQFCPESWAKFLKKAKKIKIDLIRFGAYGEPVLLGESLIQDLLSLEYLKFTGYTQRWKSELWARNYFKASVHSQKELSEAIFLGWSCYAVSSKPQKIGVICPSDLAKVTCSACGLCNANFKPNINAKLKHH